MIVSVRVLHRVELLQSKLTPSQLDTINLLLSFEKQSEDMPSVGGWSWMSGG